MITIMRLPNDGNHADFKQLQQIFVKMNRSNQISDDSATQTKIHSSVAHYNHILASPYSTHEHC